MKLGEHSKELTHNDLDGLAKSYITPELARQAGLFRVDSAEGGRIVGRNGKGDYSGIVFPFYWPGETHARSYRLRRDEPELEQKSDGTIKVKGKYLSAPGGGNRLYFSPDTRAEWLKDVNLPITITEGEKKTLALSRLAWNGVTGEQPRFLTIGLSGVWNWRGSTGKANDEKGARRDIKGVIPDLERIGWDGRTVNIIYDANVATDKSVRAARRELAKALITRGASVLFVDLPPLEGVNSVDDLLALKGEEFVLHLIATAKPAQVKVPAGFRISQGGVYSVDPTGDKEDVFICAPLTIAAATRTRDGEDWGHLLEFTDADGRQHEWAMPMSMLAGDGGEYRARLLSMGLIISPSRKARELLTTYIQTSMPDERVRCVARVGWHDGAFVLPDETFGIGERVLFQSSAGTEHRLRMAGTLADWQTNIARYCVGNTRLAFAVASAFAGPLLTLTDEGGGGFHYRGKSTIGKSTALLVAGSVWGGDSSKGYLETWRATVNGLETVAELHNHGLLCLDEISQCDPRTIGETAYMLANGIGKARMSRIGGTRRRLEWDLIFLSNGEQSLSDLAAQAGHRTRGGQEARMCDLEADAGKGMGLFEELHDIASPEALARHLSAASRRYYGIAIREYLMQLVSYQEKMREAVLNIREAFLTEHVPAGASGEVWRVAARFALVAAAGESACEVTGWPKGTSLTAAAEMFKVWLAGRGTPGHKDDEAAIQQVRAFIEAHGASRFQDVTDNLTRVFNRVGFKRTLPGGETEYLILPESFRKEVCTGYDSRATAQVLAERGYLTLGDGRNLAKRETVPELGRTRVYVISARILDEP